jgi:hypothetical protein
LQQTPKRYFIDKAMAEEFIKYYKSQFEAVKEIRASDQKNSSSSIAKNADPKIPISATEEQNMDAILQRDFGVSRIYDSSSIFALEATLFPSLAEARGSITLLERSTLEDAFHFFGPCQLVSLKGLKSIDATQSFHDRWFATESKPQAEPTLQNELQKLMKLYAIEYSLENMENFESVVITKDSIWLSFTISSLDIYNQALKHNNGTVVVDLDNSMGIRESEIQDIQKLSSKGATITRILEFIWNQKNQ